MFHKSIYKKLAILLAVILVFGAAYWIWQQRENSAKYKDLVIVSRPMPNERIASPVVVEGKARGVWFFEASFPIVVVDWDGLIIGQGIAQAQDEWMTTDYVPFRAEITFTQPVVKDNGWIILRKDNPSGLPEHDDAFEIPVFFEKAEAVFCTQEAKQCPDGSYVGRTGPKCEFAKCPDVK